jgi:hypothetical protein
MARMRKELMGLAVAASGVRMASSLNCALMARLIMNMMREKVKKAAALR